MSLLEDFSEEFYILNKVKVSDGEGGFISQWQASETTIKLAVAHNTTIEAQIAEKETTASTYTFLYDASSITFDYHDVVKRVSDGAIFRITQESGEDKTPATSVLGLGKVTAEKWELTT